MSRIDIGLIGFGTVGSGVYEVLTKNENIIRERVGTTLTIKKIAVRDLKKTRNIHLDHSLLTDNIASIIDDPEIKIIVELIGGFEPARTIVLDAIRKKKHVVTANKALLAKYGKELFQECAANNVDLCFEASVGGGIPIIRSLREAFSANRIKSIFGILNGTCNYILSKMADEGTSFEQALSEAQKLGYAEADPTFDVDGIDSAQKLAILTSIAFGGFINVHDIHTEGIRKITQVDIEFAKEFGYRIKLLAIAKETEGTIEIRVHPTMVKHSSPISNVNGVLNAIGVTSDLIQDALFVGSGAGSLPTASAVVGDIIEIGRNILNEGVGRMTTISHQPESLKEIAIKKIEKIESSYYLRFLVNDEPGVLSLISGILGKNSISIESVIQKGRNKNEGVTLVIMTHKAVEKSLQHAIAKISKLDIVLDDITVIRVGSDI